MMVRLSESEEEIQVGLFFFTVALSDDVKVQRSVFGMQREELQQEVVHILSNFGFILHVVGIFVGIRLEEKEMRKRKIGNRCCATHPVPTG
jgi:hypothetical protein